MRKTMLKEVLPTMLDIKKYDKVSFYDCKT